MIAKILADLDLFGSDLGQLILLAGVADDAVGWFGLSVVSAMAAAGPDAGVMARDVLLLLGFLALLRSAGRPLLRSVARFLHADRDPGPATALAVLVVVGTAAAVQGMGFEPLFAAFAGGLLLSAPGVVARDHLEGLRTVTFAVFAPLFLAGAGLELAPGALGDGVVLASAAVLLTVAVIGKVAGAYAGARLGGLGHHDGLALGFGLNARGVVQIVIAAAGVELGILTDAGYTVVVLVALVTSVMAGPLLRWAAARSEWGRPSGSPSPDPAPPAPGGRTRPGAVPA